MNKKNGEIEFLRFVFSILVFYNHLYKQVFFDDSLFMYSAIAVEFFFVLSGFLLAKSSYKTNNEPIGKDTSHYIARKIKSFIYPYTVSYALVFVAYCFYKGSFRKIAVFLFESIPDFFLLRGFGWPDKLLSPNGPTWYLSVLIISCSVIYPLCKKSDWFRRIGSLVVGAFLIGMLHLKYNSLVSPYALVFGEHFYKGMIRGSAEVCLGVYCYEVWLGINQIDLNRLGSFLLSSIEVLSFSAILYIIIFSHSPEYNIIGLMCVMFTIIIAFTGKTFCNSLFSSQVFFYLGKLSLSIYLSHKVIIYILSKYYDDVSFHLSNIQILLITTVPTIILGVVVNKLSCLVEKLQISRFFVQTD